MILIFWKLSNNQFSYKIFAYILYLCDEFTFLKYILSISKKKVNESESKFEFKVQELTKFSWVRHELHKI